MILITKKPGAADSAKPRAHSSALDLADRITNDPAASHWLRYNLAIALGRDAVDAVNDCELLLSILTARLEEISTEATR
jgi:hypothetical protein